MLTRKNSSRALLASAALQFVFTFSLFLCCTFLSTTVLAQTQPSSLATTGSITGTVTDDSGLPLSQIQVSAMIDVGFTWIPYKIVTTDSTGIYELNSLGKESYRLRFYDPAQTYATAYYKNVSTLVAASDISINGFPVSGINAQLSLGAQITGTVTSSNGAIIERLTANAFLPENDPGFISPIASFTVFDNQQSEISYVLRPLPAGDYVLRITGEAQGEAFTEYFENARNPSEATAITIETGQTIANLNLMLGGNSSEPLKVEERIYLPMVMN